MILRWKPIWVLLIVSALIVDVVCAQEATTTHPAVVTTQNPTSTPTSTPTQHPTKIPTRNPTSTPTQHPTKIPTRNPTSTPTQHPTKIPTQHPTSTPTRNPTKIPTQHPTSTPTRNPTKIPTRNPTSTPTTATPTKQPTDQPTQIPTENPTKYPTGGPTRRPTNQPSRFPTHSPTQNPTHSPTKYPTVNPTASPTKRPTSSPTLSPTEGMFINSLCWNLGAGRRGRRACRRQDTCKWVAKRDINRRTYGCLPERFCTTFNRAVCNWDRKNCRWDEDVGRCLEQTPSPTKSPTTFPTHAPVSNGILPHWMVPLYQECKKIPRGRQCNRNLNCQWFGARDANRKRYGCIPKDYCRDFSRRNCHRRRKFCKWGGSMCESTYENPLRPTTNRPTTAPTTAAPTPQPTTGTPTKQPTAKPTWGPDKVNILWMTMDDWAEIPYQNVAPNIEALKSAGSIVFSRAYAQFPQCGPSRYSFLSGRYPHNNRIYVSDLVPGQYDEKVTFAHEFFREKGYLVGTAGKVYHTRTGHYPAEWFDASDLTESPPSGELEFPFGVCSSYSAECTCAESQNYDNPDTCRDYSSTQMVLDWIDRWKNENQPWFITLGFVRPHTRFRMAPWAVSFEDFELGPLDFSETQGVPSIAKIDRGFCTRSDGEVSGCARSYTKLVHFVDRYIGQVVQKLKDTSQYDNTLILLHSDHGMHIGRNYRHFAKWTLFDASLEVPLIIKPPWQPDTGVPTVVDEVVELVDILPTLIEYSGVSSDGITLDGTSLAPFLRRETNPSNHYEKTVSVAYYPSCARSRSGMRSSPCTSWSNGAGNINAVGISARNKDFRYTEWRSLVNPNSSCSKRSSSSGCNSDGLCEWLMYKVYTEDWRNNMVCVPSLAKEGAIDWSESGLLASELYDESVQQNLITQSDPPADLVAAVRSLFSR